MMKGIEKITSDSIEVRIIIFCINQFIRLGFGYMLSDGKMGANMPPPSRSYVLLQRDGLEATCFSSSRNMLSRYTLVTRKKPNFNFESSYSET